MESFSGEAQHPGQPVTPWVAIQRNPHSGAGRQQRPLLDLVAGLRRHGLRPRLFSHRGKLDAAVADPVRKAGLYGIIAAGGDGTLLDVINRHHSVPVGLLPLGTENLVARYFAIPRCGTAVAAMIAAGHRRRLDVGRLGERRFVVMASIGFDAEVVHRTHAQRKGHITKSSYLEPIVSSLLGYAHPELRVFVDDATTPVVGRLVVVANLAAYALGLRVVPTACENDGALDIRVLQSGSGLAMLRYLSVIRFGSIDALSDVVQLRGQRFRVESDVPVPVQTDGDPAGWTPAEIGIEPSMVELFVPG